MMVGGEMRRAKEKYGADKVEIRSGQAYDCELDK